MSRLVGTQTVPGANSSSSWEWCPGDTSEEKEETPTASALNDKVEQVVPEIKAIIEACKTSGITQPSVDRIVKLCSDNGVAVKRNVMPRNCGIHPENRARSGVDPVNAQNLTLAISKQGYSETKLEQPMGFEKQLEGPLRDVQEKFCEQIFAESNGCMKEIPWRDNAPAVPAQSSIISLSARQRYWKATRAWESHCRRSRRRRRHAAAMGWKVDDCGRQR